MERMARRPALVKVLIGVGAFALFAFLFMRSLQSTREAPFVLDATDLTGWTLAVQPPADPFGAWLALRPPAPFATALGGELFARGGESVNYPSPAGIPLLLRREFDRAFAGRIAPETITGLAAELGVTAPAWTPRCMGYRRVSEPRGPRAAYFVLFEAPAFDRFRQGLSAALREAGGDVSAFDPTALSPALIVAALDGDFEYWMPLRATADADCFAPIELG
jgi:hypothetical protein